MCLCNTFRDDDDDDEDHLEAGAGAQARKVAAQAVIELTDKLTRAEQENVALRQRLHESRRLSKVMPKEPIQSLFPTMLIPGRRVECARAMVTLPLVSAHARDGHETASEQVVVPMEHSVKVFNLCVASR